MSEEIPAPDVDLSAPIYADTPESQIVPAMGATNYPDGELLFDDDDFEPVTPFQAEVLRRLDSLRGAIAEQANTQTELKNGVNTIGTMMNGVADAFGQIMTQVQKGGIASLLGSMMGGKKNDSEEG